MIGSDAPEERNKAEGRRDRVARRSYTVVAVYPVESKLDVSLAYLGK